MKLHFYDGKSILPSFTSEVEVLPVVIGSEVDVFHNVSFGPVSMLALSVLGCFQHGHASIGKVSGEGCIQRPFIIAARGIAGTPAATDAALLQSRKHLTFSMIATTWRCAWQKLPV